MSHQQERQMRIRTLRKWISDAMLADVTVDEQKIVAECCLAFGAGRRYVLEYLKDLEITGFLIRKEGKIWTPEAYEIDKMLKLVPVEEKNTKLEVNK